MIFHIESPVSERIPADQKTFWDQAIGIRLARRKLPIREIINPTGLDPISKTAPAASVVKPRFGAELQQAAFKDQVVARAPSETKSGVPGEE